MGQGHDLDVLRCRLTECTLGMEACADIGAKVATAIEIDFPDSHFRDTVITCGRAGVVNRGGANTFRSVHADSVS
jgi:DhnA family fructose-bisphosphate aldolase class Ia